MNEDKQAQDTQVEPTGTAPNTSVTPENTEQQTAELSGLEKTTEKPLLETPETVAQLPAEAASVSLWARRKWWIVGAVMLVLAAAVAAFLLTR